MNKKDERPLVSVVVPVYNVEKYLPECVDSIISQSYANLEIILVDDGSPDNCPALCDEYAEKDKRVQVIHKKNGGLSDARNAGIKKATGKYICFIDSDDYVAKTFIEKLYEALDKNNANMSVCGYKCVYSDGTMKIDERPKEAVLGEDDYWLKVNPDMFTTFVVAWNKLYKKEIFAKIRYEKGKINEDEIILHQVVSQCKRIAVISDKLYFYRKREDSIMGAKKKNELSDDAYEGLLGRAEYFLSKGKYELCAQQIYFLLGETVSRRQAKKFSKRVKAIVARIPKSNKPKDLDLKVLVLRFAPTIYCLKRLR
jgi:glycosyltransferase involved in cell wall biosynthesis